MNAVNNEIYVIPTTGLRVIDPATNQPLPAEGAIVRGNRDYWIRRMNDGDVKMTPVEIVENIEQERVTTERSASATAPSKK